MFEPIEEGDISKTAVSNRWVPTWKIVDDKKCVQALLVATGYRNPDLKDGVADGSRRVRLRSSHLQVISPGTIGKLRIRSFDIRDAPP